MKKHVLLASALVASAGLFAQNGKQLPTATPINRGLNQIQKNAVIKENTAQTGVNNTTSNAKNGVGHYSPQFTGGAITLTTTASRFSGSMNAYGVLTSQQKPLQYNSAVGVVTFVHRKSPFSTTAPASNSGAMETSWTTNNGTSWDSTCIWSDATNTGRYPQGGIYNPPGNTNINNIYFVGTGPVTAGSGWTGNWYASKPYSASTGGNMTALGTPTTQFIAHAYQGSNQQFVRSFYTNTDDGKVRAAGTVMIDINGTTNIAQSPRGMAMMRGTFSAGSFAWTLDSLLYPVVTSTVNGPALSYQPYMAWNNSGTIGYAVMIGVRTGATGAQKGMQPIVYKTTNSGTSWTLMPPFNFTSLQQVWDRLPLAVKGDTTHVPFFTDGEGMDITVDNLGRLHLVGTVVSAYSQNVDSLFYTYAFNSGGSCGTQNYSYFYGNHLGMPTIMDFVFDGTSSWNGIVVDTMGTEGTTGSSNTCSQWSGASLSIDARIQVSRNDAGTHLFYSWTETDTTVTGNHWNIYPNIYMRAYDITSGLVTPKYCVTCGLTTPAAITSGSFFHYMANRSMNLGGGDEGIPFTVSLDGTFSGTGAVNHVYIAGAKINSSAYTHTATPLSSTSKAGNGISKALDVTVNAYPNPTNDITNLSVSLKKYSNIQVEIVNNIGQVINTISVNGVAGTNVINVDLSNQAAGIYFYNVKTDAGKVSGKLIKQ